MAVATLDRPGGHKIAYLRRPGRELGLTWLSGFKSDMTGTKATAVDAFAKRRGLACLRFDYFGHGRSSGAFVKGTIGRWRDDALAALDRLTDGPQILVGSSMGAWIALLAALDRPERVKGLVLIAPAVDFTEDLLWARLPEEALAALRSQGVWMRPSAYDPAPYPIALSLIEEGRDHLLLRGQIELTCPVHILHGMADPDVPWQHSLRLVDCLASREVVAEFSKSGDHRLSSAGDIARLEAAIDGIIERPTGR